ncbi:MAG: ABC transporter substrate-binding protein [Firmicutes bacterium]|nr:ABC transporter substrate-binding protein [Bacillota bacterium]
MKVKRFFAALLALCTVAVLSSCSGHPSDSNIRIAIDAVPYTFDPQLASNRCEQAVVRNTFEGLMRINSDGEAVCGACSDYTVSDDRLTYTFTLRDGLKWSNGDDCTADDFVFGLRRAVDPLTKAPDAHLLDSIKNASAIMSGKMNTSSLGVSADGNRVIIVLERADSNLLHALSCAVAMPCNEQFFDSTGGRYGMAPEDTLYNGSFKLSKWSSSSLSLVRNSRYNGPFEAVGAGAVISFGATSYERIKGLSSNLYDIAIIDTQGVNEALSSGLSVERFTSTCWSLIYNSDDSFLSRDGVIRSLSATVGDGYKSMIPVGFEQCTGFVAEGLTVGSCSYGANDGLTPFSGDINAAKAAVKQAIKAHKSTPTLTVTYVDTDGMQMVASQIASSWQQNFGITVNLSAVPLDAIGTAVSAGEYQIAIYPVTADDGRVLSVFSSPAMSGIADLTADVSRLTGSADPRTVIDTVKAAEQTAVKSGLIVPIMSSGLCCAYTDRVKNLCFDMHQGTFDIYNTWA